MRRLALVLLLAALPAAAALGPRYGGVLRVGVPGEERRGLTGSLVSGLVDATLLESDADGTLRPALAAGWGSAAGGREWTLRLHPAARFHDGAPVTADDAVRALRRFARTPGAAGAELARRLDGGDAFRAQRRDELPGLSAPDARSVVLRLVPGAPDPLLLLAAADAAVTSSSGAGAGPFVARTPTRFTAFVEHVRGRPFLDAVELHPVDARRVASELQAGAIDAAVSLAGAHGPSATLLLVVDPAAVPEAGHRAALDRAIDRAGLVRHLLPRAEPARLLLPPTLLAAPPEVVAPAPMSAVPGRLTLAVSTDVPPLVSQRVVALLLRTGVQLDVAPTPPHEVAASPAALRLLAWSPSVPDSAVALRELLDLAPAAGLAPLVDAADAEPLRDRRRTRLYEAERQLRETRLVLPLAVLPAGLRARPGLHGVVVDGAGRPRLDDAWREP